MRLQIVLRLTVVLALFGQLAHSRAVSHSSWHCDRLVGSGGRIVPFGIKVMF
jgi:hypothetical protein